MRILEERNLVCIMDVYINMKVFLISVKFLEMEFILTLSLKSKQ